jgi:lysophospholipase L1-like esterase
VLKSLCLFGDSVTKGVVLDASRNRYSFLKDSFVNCFASATGAAIDNFSKFGCTARKGIEIVSRHSDKLSEYDFVILEFGGNDCNYDWAKIAEAPDAEHTPNAPLGQFVEYYRRIIDNIKIGGGRPIILNMPPLNSEKFYNWVSKGLNAENIMDWLHKDIEHIHRWQASYNSAIGELAESTKTPLIDIRSSFMKTPDYKMLLCEDGMHPNSEGHKLIYDALMRFVNKNGILA